ncbi:aminotransferase class I/II-fold pyridoxal phosphate-dependent enzyme [Microbacterium sp. NPDC096154]|uniref:MalY/PatB family protein n=1 Tax=Microbacterium sp. NPDC096154 TaxID=3155549 RepID=UPI00331D9C7D
MTHSRHPFDAITVQSLREVGSMKWTMFPDTLAAWVAEMDFGVAPPITDALHAAVDRGAFGYLPPADARAMSEAFATWSAQRYGWSVDPDDVHAFPDVIAALEVAIEHFSAPGSAVVVPTPAYMPFLTVPLALGRRVVQVPMARDGERWVYDLDALDQAFADGAGMLVLCNPHNPIGRVLDPLEMAAIGEIVARHGARVFSDEIHAPLVYPGRAHVPYASVNEATASHTLTATSASKAWNLPGLKTAQVIVSNSADGERWVAEGRMWGHGAANLGVIANTAAYSAGGPWLDDVVDYLDGSRRLLGELVAAHLPGVAMTQPEGTYLAWLECAALDLAGSPAEFFREHAGVVLTDGELCGDIGATAVRLNFATPRPVLEQIVAAMGNALRQR